MKEHVEILCRQHDELRGLADDYERELDKPGADLAALAGCRWKLARLISTHLASERMYLYAALAKRGDQTGEPLGKRLGSLADKLSAHVRNWTPASIADDWAGYGRASRELMKVLREQIAREESELYPLLLVAKTA